MLGGMKKRSMQGEGVCDRGGCDNNFFLILKRQDGRGQDAGKGSLLGKHRRKQERIFLY